MDLTGQVVTVKEVQSSRYPPGLRPLKWETRVEGLEVIRDESGAAIRLWSGAAQAAPSPGCQLFLVKRREGGENEVGYEWTLYGLSPSND